MIILKKINDYISTNVAYRILLQCLVYYITQVQILSLIEFHQKLDNGFCCMM